MATATQLRWLLTPDDASIDGKPPAQGWTPCEVGRRPSSRTGVLSVGRFTPPDGKFDNSAPRRIGRDHIARPPTFGVRYRRVAGAELPYG